jgi:hypothetical protein
LNTIFCKTSIGTLPDKKLFYIPAFCISQMF